MIKFELHIYFPIYFIKTNVYQDTQVKVSFHRYFPVMDWFSIKECIFVTIKNKTFKKLPI